jgi:hypothetical protein
VPYQDTLSGEWRTILEKYDPDFVVDMAEMSEDDKAWLQTMDWPTREWKRPFKDFSLEGVTIYSVLYDLVKDPKPENWGILMPRSIPGHYFLPLLMRYGRIDESNINAMLNDHMVHPLIRVSEFLNTLVFDFPETSIDFLFDDPTGPANNPISKNLWSPLRLTQLELPGPGHSKRFLDTDHPEFETEERRTARFILVTGAANSIQDGCLFWAIRAVRGFTDNPFPLWLPLDVLKSEKGLAKLVAKATQRTNRRVGYSDDLYVLSSTATSAEIESVLGNTVPYHFVDSNFADFVNGKDWQRGFQETFEIHFEQGKAHIPRAQVPFSKLFSNVDRMAQELEIPEVVLPRAYRSLGRNFWRVTNNGVSLLFWPRSTEAFSSLEVPSAWNAFEVALKQLGLLCEPSDKGRLGVGLLELVGSLQAFGVLASSKIFGVLAKMSEGEGRQYFRRALARIDDHLTEAQRNEFSSIENPASGSRTSFGFSDFVNALGRESAQKVLDWLVRRRIVFRGADLTCANCQLKRWYIIDDIGTEIRCQGCQQVSDAPLGAGQTAWRYRLNELFARSFDQGVLVHLLLAYHRSVEHQEKSFWDRPGAFAFYPGIVIKNSNGVLLGELDYVEIQSGKLMTGECKVSQVRFDSQERQKLKRISRSLGSSEQIFATLDSLSEETAQSIASDFATCVVYDSHRLMDRLPWQGEQLTPEEYLRAQTSGAQIQPEVLRP